MKNKDMNTEIGHWMRDRRIEQGMSQQDVADIMNTTRTAVHYWETGKRTIYAVNFLDYCSAIGVDAQRMVDDLAEVRKK